MENLTTLLTQLAEKLGTTVEHLWGVLLKQAEITIWINSIGIVISVFILIILIGLTKYAFNKHKRMEKDDNYRYDATEQWEIYKWVGFILSCFAIIITTVVTTISLQEIIICVANPEYWALQEILH